ncbi:MAG: hypothetical protein M3Y72_21345, partial [Acidobacteriota bacterium]|nr:hypothetical protein [Acidobacteriota bacterium]
MDIRIPDPAQSDSIEAASVRASLSVIGEDVIAAYGSAGQVIHKISCHFCGITPPILKVIGTDGGSVVIG